MNQKPSNRGIKASPRGLEILNTSKASRRDCKDKPLTYEKLSEEARVSDRTIKRFFRGEAVSLSSAIAIIEALGLSKEDILSSEATLVSETIEEIEYRRAEHPERASALVERLEESLSELKAQEHSSLRAMEWLKANRRSLSQDAARTVSNRFYGQESSSSDRINDIDNFSQEIRKYLQLVYHAVELGSWQLLDEAIREVPPPVTREPQMYVEALQFIKEQRVKQDLLPEESREVELCLEYLIQLLPIRL